MRSTNTTVYFDADSRMRTKESKKLESVKEQVIALLRKRLKTEKKEWEVLCEGRDAE